MVVSGRKLGVLVAVGLLLVALLVASCTSTPSTSSSETTSSPPSSVSPAPSVSPKASSTTAVTAAGNVGPAHDFFWGLTGDGYRACKLVHEQEGETDVHIIGVRVDTDKETRATYDAIYTHATSSAQQYGIATDRGELLRVVLVEATSDQKIIESRDFDLSDSDGGSTATSIGVATTSTTLGSMAESVPADFGFVAAYGVTSKNVLDTVAGTFTKDIISPKPNPTVELRLTAEELAILYQDLVDMNILNYPSVFQPELEDTSGTMVIVQPYETYVLTIRMAGVEKHIAWEDAHQMQTPKAKALRDWFTKLRVMIEAKPEYQAMPPVEGGFGS